MAPSSPSWLLCLVLWQGLWVVSVALVEGGAGEATWCVARSNASNLLLQSELDYACGAGADCAPIQLDGLCYLPNTFQSHASYAFNSYYQRKAKAPGSCDFSGAATVAMTEPSYGSCVYPSSVSTAGGMIPGTPSTPTINSPNSTATTTVTSSGGLTPLSSTVPNTDDDSAASLPSSYPILLPFLCILSLLLIPI